MLHQRGGLVSSLATPHPLVVVIQRRYILRLSFNSLATGLYSIEIVILSSLVVEILIVSAGAHSVDISTCYKLTC